MDTEKTDIEAAEMGGEVTVKIDDEARNRNKVAEFAAGVKRIGGETRAS